MFLRFQKVNGLNIQAEYKSSKQADSYSLLISIYQSMQEKLPVAGFLYITHSPGWKAPE